MNKDGDTHVLIGGAPAEVLSTRAVQQSTTDLVDQFAGEIAARRMAEDGWDTEPDEIAAALYFLRRSLDLAGREGRGSESTTRVSGIFTIERRSGGGGTVSATTPGGQTISFSVRDAKDETVVIETRQASASGEVVLCDPPTGGPARVEVQIDHSRTRAYVGREEHYSHGVKWDPSLEKAADIFYHDNGEILCKTRYLQGGRQSRGDNPVFEAFWSSGVRRIAEYGQERAGKHRSPAKGPAYLEFDEQGKAVFSFFAKNGILCASGEGKDIVREPGGRLENINFDGMPASELTQAEAWAARARAKDARDQQRGRTKESQLAAMARVGNRATKIGRLTREGGGRVWGRVTPAQRAGI